MKRSFCKTKSRDQIVYSEDQIVYSGREEAHENITSAFHKGNLLHVEETKKYYVSAKSAECAFCGNTSPTGKSRTREIFLSFRCNIRKNFIEFYRSVFAYAK